MTARCRPFLVVALALLTLQCHEPSTAPTPITHLPRDLTTAEGRLVSTDNRFAFKLFRQIADSTPADSSLFISPLSVAMALTMTYNGAAGSTQQEMATALELNDFPLDELNASYRGLIDLLRGLDRQVTFEIANSIWYRHDWTFEQAFLDANRTYFDARVEAIDFLSPAAAPTINNWVKQQTQGLILEIVPDPIPEGAVMYLINAIYFKGDWTQQFDPERTQPRPFRLPDGSSVNVPTMTHGGEADIRLTSRPTATIVDMPYGGEAFSMTIVLPSDSIGVDDLVTGLTAEQWNDWTASLQPSENEVFLPKFKLSNDLTLNPSLKALGMSIAYDCVPPVMADFTRMFAGGGVCITNVKHKTYVDVNAEGTEAAAVTSVEMGVTSVGPPAIYINRPFIFALRENLSGTILFMGVIRNPAGE